MRDGSWEEFEERYRKEEKVTRLDSRKNTRSLRTSGKRWTLGQCARQFEEERGLRAEGHRAGRCHLVVFFLPALQQFSFGGLHLVGIDGTRRQQQEKEEALQLVVCGVRGANTNGEHPTGYWWCSSLPTPTKQKCSECTRRHRGCEKMINVLKLLANQRMVAARLKAYRKGITDGLRSFIKMDNHSALDVGHLRKGLRPFQGPEAEIQ